MDENEFWRIIGLFDWASTGDDDAVLAPAVKALAEHPVEGIQQFEEILSQKLHALDTMAHAREIGEDAFVDETKHFSVDQFLYARCCVLANGSEFYQEVLADPAGFPKDMEFESVLYLADAAYELKCGEEAPVWDTSVSYETFHNRAGWVAG